MQYSVVAMCAVLMFYFFRTCCFEVLYGQLWNVLHFYIPGGSRLLKCNKNRCFFWSFHNKRKGILFFILFSCFKQCVLGLSGLLGLNAVIILPLYSSAPLTLPAWIKAWNRFCAILSEQDTSVTAGLAHHMENGLNLADRKASWR